MSRLSGPFDYVRNLLGRRRPRDAEHLAGMVARREEWAESLRRQGEAQRRADEAKREKVVAAIEVRDEVYSEFFGRKVSSEDMEK